MVEISNTEILIRLLVVTAISGVIGLEREYHRRPAGLRTNIMVGLGSALMTIASVKTAVLFPEMKAVDPTRIAAQIVTGIGFIGAGAILRPQNTDGSTSVVGLTTAATMWVVCGIGIAIGLGLYFEGILTAFLVFFTFLAMRKVVMWVRDFSRRNPPDGYTDLDEH